MDYEGQICKPPMEIGRFMLPVAVGCSYNACRFCTLFKHLKFRELPLDKVEAELLRVKNLGGSPKKILGNVTLTPNSLLHSNISYSHLYSFYEYHNINSIYLQSIFYMI